MILPKFEFANVLVSFRKLCPNYIACLVASDARPVWSDAVPLNPKVHRSAPKKEVEQEERAPLVLGLVGEAWCQNAELFPVVTLTNNTLKLFVAGCSSAQMDKEMKDGQPLVSKPITQKMDRGEGENEADGARQRGGTLDQEEEKDAWWAKDKA
eukprot:scaffold1170_cov122-Cylindrotheca_fusiformis.AAC.16